MESPVFKIPCYSCFHFRLIFFTLISFCYGIESHCDIYIHTRRIYKLALFHFCFLCFFTDLDLKRSYGYFKEDFRPLFKMCFVSYFSSCFNIGMEKYLN